MPFYGVIPWARRPARLVEARAAVSATTPATTSPSAPTGAATSSRTLRDAGKDAELHIYPGADHAFFNDTRPEVYDAAASATAGRSGPFLAVPRSEPGDDRERGRSSTATSSSGSGSAATSTVSSTPTTGRAAAGRARRRRAGVPPRGCRPTPPRLIADLDAGAGDPTRRRSPALAAGPGRRACSPAARKLAGEPIGYADEVEACYGVRPEPGSTKTACDAAPPPRRGAARYRPAGRALIAGVARRPGGAAESCGRLGSLADDLRERTDRRFGLPDGEHVDFELVTDKPWSGLQLLPGRPALASRDQHRPAGARPTSLAHLVAHEAYPGHHTEHTRKEVGLVRPAASWRRRSSWWARRSA